MLQSNTRQEQSEKTTFATTKQASMKRKMAAIEFVAGVETINEDQLPSFREPQRQHNDDDDDASCETPKDAVVTLSAAEETDNDDANKSFALEVGNKRRKTNHHVSNRDRVPEFIIVRNNHVLPPGMPLPPAPVLPQLQLGEIILY